MPGSPKAYEYLHAAYYLSQILFAVGQLSNKRKKENPTDQKSAQENKLSANYENIEIVVCVFDTFENDNLEKRWTYQRKTYSMNLFDPTPSDKPSSQ